MMLTCLCCRDDWFLSDHLRSLRSEEQTCPSACVSVCSFRWSVLVGPWVEAAAWALLTGPVCHSGLLPWTLRACQLSSSHLLWQTAGTESVCTSWQLHTETHLAKWSRCDWPGLCWRCQPGRLVRLLFSLLLVWKPSLSSASFVRTRPVVWGAVIGSDWPF